MDAVSLATSLPGRIVALVGAGCSTDSGIPDYRGQGTARRARNPIQHRAFVTDAAARRRYWARSFLGWPRIMAASPNAGHRALAELEASGALVGVVTQNVDGLHHEAGNRCVVELHGALRRVVCLVCGATTPRQQLQARLEDANPGFRAAAPVLLADGDAEAEPPEDFHVVPCVACGGVLMPDVVFFGGSVPRQRVAQASRWVDEADALLVVGSSLTVFSGFRFVRHAVAANKPVGIVNLGPTRADGLATLKVEAPISEVLPAFAKVKAGCAAPAPPPTPPPSARSTDRP